MPYKSFSPAAANTDLLSSNLQQSYPAFLQGLSVNIPAPKQQNCLEQPTSFPQHKLSELLPYDPSVKKGTRLKDGLKEFLLLIIACEQALAAMQQGDFKSFDPLVGENACQIRAVKLAVIFSETFEICVNLIKDLACAKQKIENLINYLKLPFSNETSLQDLLKNEGIEIVLDYRFIFILKTYLLSKVKVSRPFKDDQPLLKNEYTDTKKIKEISNVGSMFADNLVTHLRGKLSERSVRFVQQIAQDQSSMLSDEYIFNHRGLQCLPCFWATRALLKHALEKSIPLVVIAEQKAKDQNYSIIRKTVIFFKATRNGYKKAEYKELPVNAPAIYLQGSSCGNFADLLDDEAWQEDLIKYCPIEMILAYAAVHRQYPDSTKDQVVETLNDNEYEYYKKVAPLWGCTADNPSRFFLAHAFCDKISNFSLHTS